jgi:hypothetical protein
LNLYGQKVQDAGGTANQAMLSDQASRGFGESGAAASGLGGIQDKMAKAQSEAATNSWQWVQDYLARKADMDENRRRYEQERGDKNSWGWLKGLMGAGELAAKFI